jgi:hypothetical protein
MVPVRSTTILREWQAVKFDGRSARGKVVTPAGVLGQELRFRQKRLAWNRDARPEFAKWKGATPGNQES